MDGRCKTCKWWDADSRQNDYDADMKRRSRHDPFVPPAGRGYCTQPNTSMMTIELRGYCEENEEIMTAPSFGCVLWEAK